MLWVAFVWECAYTDWESMLGGEKRQYRQRPAATAHLQIMIESIIV
jgi:hypothetical protein